MRAAFVRGRDRDSSGISQQDLGVARGARHRANTRGGACFWVWFGGAAKRAVDSFPTFKRPSASARTRSSFPPHPPRRSRLAMPRAFHIPGVIFLFCAFILLILVSISLPFITALDVARVHFKSGSPTVNSDSTVINELRVSTTSRSLCTRV